MPTAPDAEWTVRTRCHPARWLWGLIPIAMLSWIAVQCEVSSIQTDLERRSTAALAAAGHGWASVAFDGREGLLVGHPLGERQRQEALAVVRDVWGVRSVRSQVATTAFADLPMRPAPEIGAPSHPLAEVAPHDMRDHAFPALEDLAGGTLVAVAAAPAHGLHAREHGEDGASRGTTLRASVGASGDQVAAVEAADSPQPIAAPPAAIAARTAPMPGVPLRKPAAETMPAAAVEPSAATVSAREAPSTQPADVQSARPEGPAPTPQTTTEPSRAAQAPAAAPVAEPALPKASPPTPKVALAPLTDASGGGPSTAPPPPPLPNRPRFDTAALPPGNMASAATCWSGVKTAARRVEVHFARGDAGLDTQGKALLDGLVAALDACPDAALRIAGHADSSGQSHHNRVLSQRRAKGVAAYMVDKGIDARRLVAIGYGDTQPLAPNDTQANRARNRRIELSVRERSMPPMPVRKQGTPNGLSRR